MTTASLETVLDAFRADPPSGPQLTWHEAAELQPDFPAPAMGPLSPRSIELLKQQGRTLEEIRELMEGRQPRRPPLIRVGRFGGWTAIIEHFTARGTDLELLEAGSRAGERSVVYCFTQTIACLLYARDGVLLSGFDATVPTIRWGTNQWYFDDLLAGVVGQLRPVSPAEIAQILKDGFDVAIDRGVLEGPLPAATLKP